MKYTKKQLQEMYLKFCETKLKESKEFSKYTPVNTRHQGNINTLTSLLGGSQFIESLE